jgi:hypothetical protein
VTSCDLGAGLNQDSFAADMGPITCRQPRYSSQTDVMHTAGKPVGDTAAGTMRRLPD